VSEFDPKTIYVLQDPDDGFIRIFCEADNTNLIFADTGFAFVSKFPTNATSFSTFIKSGYEIIQEWN
jgi:hypothetical protein